MRKFYYRVMRSIFGYERQEMAGASQNYIMRSLIIIPFTQGDEIKDNRIGEACNLCIREITNPYKNFNRNT
jgi:hypothetical protein